MIFSSACPNNSFLLPGWQVILLSTLLTLLAGPLLQASYAEASFGSPDSSQENIQTYKTAKKYLGSLQKSPTPAKQRAAWLIAVRNFRRLYLLESSGNGKLAPSCLLMIARTYRQMFQRFHLPIDLDESIHYYLQLADAFPQNRLADDALFAAAKLYETAKRNPIQAAALYEKITVDYPAGDKSHSARRRLNSIKRNRYTMRPASHHSTPDTQPAAILPIKHWSSADYTRIVIPATAPVPYTTSLLEKDGDQPRRLYIKLHRSHIARRNRKPVSIEDGLLKLVRSEQLGDDMVQVVVDIESISDYKIFSLKDPFRIIIDVHGMKKRKVEKETAAAFAERPKKKPEVRKTTSPPVFITLTDTKKKKPRKKRRYQKTAGQRRPHKQPPLSLAQQLGLGIRKIIIDPGHGGKDPGAMAFGLKEKNIVLKVAKKVKKILQKKFNYEVILTRSKDVFIPLEERTAIANTTGADLFISIHVNAHPDKTVQGIETFYLNLATNAEAMRIAARENATSTHNISEMQAILSDLMQNSKIIESSRLARSVQHDLISGLKKENYPVQDHGVKKAPFYVLIGAQMPAVLAEISFITNPGDAKRLRQDDFLNDIAGQIADGIADYSANHLITNKN